MLSVLPSRKALLAAAATLALIPIVATGPSEAALTNPCLLDTKTRLKNSSTFAAGSKLNVYKGKVAGFDKVSAQEAKVLRTSFPAGTTPRLLAPAVGTTTAVSTLVRNQRPTALAAINGDFFTFRTIRDKKMTFSRGVLIENKKIIRGTNKKGRAVGVDTAKQPFGGKVGVTGTVSSGGRVYAVKSVNWHAIKQAGATIYTTDWNASWNTPRPLAATEWVVQKGKIIKVRKAKSGSLGAPVAAGTKVVSFPKDLADSAGAVAEGSSVRLNVQQKTSTGVTVRSAVGRGATLVNNGQIAIKCGNYEVAKRPRQIVGWTATGQWRVLTVPGSSFDSNGFRLGGFGLPQTANLAKKFGLTQAYVLDGGGSTVLLTRNDAGNWKRRDINHSYERPVPSGLSFTK